MSAFARQPDAHIAAESGHTGNIRTGQIRALPRAILQALQALATDGRECAIDPRGLPLGPGDEQALKAALGAGEIGGLVRDLGEREVQQTAYPGCGGWSNAIRRGRWWRSP